MAVKRIVQRASDRRKDDLIGKKEVYDIRRIRAATQDEGDKISPPRASGSRLQAISWVAQLLRVLVLCNIIC
jgi:hypothetical protein